MLNANKAVRNAAQFCSRHCKKVTKYWRSLRKMLNEMTNVTHAELYSIGAKFFPVFSAGHKTLYKIIIRENLFLKMIGRQGGTVLKKSLQFEILINESRMYSPHISNADSMPFSHGLWMQHIDHDSFYDILCRTVVCHRFHLS